MSKTIKVPEEIAIQVKELVETGDYPDSESTARDAFRLLHEERQRHKLRKLVAEADAEIAAGESDLWSDALSERLMREAQELYRSGAKPDSDDVL